MTKNHKPGTEIEMRKEDLEAPAPKRRKLKGVESNKNNITTLANILNFQTILIDK